MRSGLLFRRSDRATIAESSRSRLAGLDELRALAVAAVLVFHFKREVLPGGFLGVDLFFALSGFLITRLLLDEFVHTGRIGLAEFYRRRARRLLPAVLTLIVTALLASVLFWRDELEVLRGATVANLFYVGNWQQVLAHQSYFASIGRPSMLQHLWSLAIEEQFYLLWPVLLAMIARFARRRAATEGIRSSQMWLYRRVTLIGLGGALLSTALMATLAIVQDVPYRSDSSRVYFGTDTHAMGLLLGAVAAALATARVRRPMPAPRTGSTSAPRLLERRWCSDLLGAAAAYGLWRMARDLDEYSVSLYRGGFLLASALSVVLVLCVARTGSGLAAALARVPGLRWAGRRSYAIYLWHWPVAVVTRPGYDLQEPQWQILMLRVAVTLLLAELSYRLIESPVRNRAFAAWRPQWRRLLYGVGTAAVALGAIGSITVATSSAASAPNAAPVPAVLPSVPAPAPAPATATSAVSVPPTIAFTLPAGKLRPEPAESATAAPSTPAPTKPAPMSVARAGAPVAALPAPTAAPTISETPKTAAPRAVYFAFGDSVLLGAAPAIRPVLPGVTVQAVEGQQPYRTLDVVERTAGARSSHAVVILHTGNNGLIPPKQLATVLGQLHGAPRVVLLTDRVPRDWQDRNNKTLRDVAKRFGNVVLLDWRGESEHHSGWFHDDGLHLTARGAAAYAALIRTAVTR